MWAILVRFVPGIIWHVYEHVAILCVHLATQDVNILWSLSRELISYATNLLFDFSRAAVWNILVSWKSVVAFLVYFTPIHYVERKTMERSIYYNALRLKEKIFLHSSILFSLWLEQQWTERIRLKDICSGSNSSFKAWVVAWPQSVGIDVQHILNAMLSWLLQGAVRNTVCHSPSPSEAICQLFWCTSANRADRS